jgi:alpha-mannosidase
LQHKVLWTPKKIEGRLQLIQPLIHRQFQPLAPFRYKELTGPLAAPPIAVDVDDSDWEVIAPGTYWGKWTTDFAMRTRFAVPSDWGKDLPIMVFLPLGDSGDFSHPETLAYIDGQPYAAADRHHHELLLDEQWLDGKEHTLALHGWTGLGGFANNDLNTRLYMRPCGLVQVDPATREFVAVVRVALEVTQQLDDDDLVKGRIYNALDKAFKTVDTRDIYHQAQISPDYLDAWTDDNPYKPHAQDINAAVEARRQAGQDAFYNSVPAALDALKQDLQAAGDPLDVDVVGVGHAHIDVAWLWTLDQTIRKSGRTFSTVLRLMEEFPEYKFTQSQPQLYKYTEEHYPELFEQIKERVKEGRWELLGGTWVEPDINAIGAESLARQFLLGRNYFRKHFGDVETPVLWLPDTFGYSWALPQLIKLAGMKYFITHKMSWNQYNQMPHQILRWRGLDGTEVITHFLTTLGAFGRDFLPYSTTYNGEISGWEIFSTWKNFRQKETHNELLTAYGYGDGGGGPNREMLENIRAFNTHPGAPRVRTGTVREFMERIDNEVGDDLPVWNGEFYLEYHRGTYTSQAKTKRQNRKSEFLMNNAEFLAAYAALATGYTYPHEDLNAAWELICLNQFHDILPGSSVGAVYKDSDRDYAKVRELGEKVRQSAVEALAASLPQNASALVANSTSFAGPRLGLMPDASGTFVDSRSGETLASQPVDGGTLIAFPSVEPFTVFGLAAADGEAASTEKSVSVSETNGGIVLENDLIRVELSSGGHITRIFDKDANREVLEPGQTGNQLQAFEDRPMMFDAWDIDIYFEDRMEPVEGLDSMTVIERGPLRAGIEIKRTYRHSQIIQKIYLYHDSKQIDFDTWADWREHHILLKAAFPVLIDNPQATFEVQWGNVQRSTHRNTSWDWGQFETCAHKWADLSEGNYGVALMNDCKYGYDIHDNVMRLSLIKSATMPDPVADQGEHVFTYSLLPHTSDWRGEVVPAAYKLNNPLIVQPISGGQQADGSLQSLVTVDVPNVVVETVKLAEDGDGLIVRMYECQRNRGPVTVTAGFPLKEAYICNLLEENQSELAIQDNQITVEMTPYQIVNLRLKK